MIKASYTFVLSIFAVLMMMAVTGPLTESGAWAQSTGLPLPRHVSLRANEANLRTGPGVQYPVDWIYQREGLPLEIIKEYRTWRLVRDWEGTQGWMHQSMLSGKRTFMTIGKTRTVRAKADAKSRAVANLEPGTIGELTACPRAGGWCRVRVRGIDGWLRRVEFWGVYRSEVFE